MRREICRGRLKEGTIDDCQVSVSNQVQYLGDLEVQLHLASVLLAKLDLVLLHIEIRVLEDEVVEFVERLFELVDRLDQFRQQMQPGLHFRQFFFLGKQWHPGLGGPRLLNFSLVRLHDLKLGDFVFSFLLAILTFHY